jgi:hypothetical protein
MHSSQKAFKVFPNRNYFDIYEIQYQTIIMPIPAFDEIFTVFSRHPLADKGLNNNIVAYILSGTDKDRLLNDDAT